MQSSSFRLPLSKGSGFLVSRRVNLLNGISKRNYQNDKVKNFDEIPGPKPFPIIGHAWRYLPLVGYRDTPKDFEDYCMMHEKFGNIVKESTSRGREIVHVFGQKDIAAVYQSEGETPLRHTHRAIMKYRRDRSSVYNSAGLLPTNGEEWLKFRKLFNDILLSPKNAEACSVHFENVVDDLMHLLERSFLLEKDFQPDLFKWALECFGVVALDSRLGCFDYGKFPVDFFQSRQEVKNLLKTARDICEGLYLVESGSLLWQYVSTPSYRKLVSAQDYITALINKYVDGAIEAMKHFNIDSAVLAKMLAVPGAEKKDVITMIVDMFLSGIDTSAYTMGFVFYNLARNAPVQNRLREELKLWLPHKNSMLKGREMDIPYLRAVLNESLRLNSAFVGVQRELTNDMVLSGYNVPAGTQVYLQHQVASRKHENFCSPNAFLPDRWIEDSEHYEDYEKTKPCLHVPFGTGARMCIGKEFSERQMLVLLAKVIRNFKIEYFYSSYGDVESCSRLINVPNKPLQLIFLPTSE